MQRKVCKWHLSNCMLYFILGCDAKADVVLLLDSSGSIGNSEWEKVIQFADSLIQELQISSSQTRVGVATFASNAR